MKTDPYRFAQADSGEDGETAARTTENNLRWTTQDLDHCDKPYTV